MFLKAEAAVVGGTIIVGGLVVAVDDDIVVALEREIDVDKEGEPITAAGLEILVTVEDDLTIDLESC